MNYYQFTPTKAYYVATYIKYLMKFDTHTVYSFMPITK